MLASNINFRQKFERRMCYVRNGFMGALRRRFAYLEYGVVRGDARQAGEVR